MVELSSAGVATGPRRAILHRGVAPKGLVPGTERPPTTRGIDHTAKMLQQALLGATALSGFTLPQVALAQDAAPQGAADDGQAAVEPSSVITVTARRRDESIVDVPLAITV